MANAVRNILRLKGTLSPKSFKIAKEKAISVAMGIPHPWAVWTESFKKRNNNKGKIIPPMAAKSGNIAFLSPLSSPIRSSLFISNPIRKKNKAMSPSLIQRIRGFVSWKVSEPIPILYCHKEL
jgi:hypothetical protein